MTFCYIFKHNLNCQITKMPQKHIKFSLIFLFLFSLFINLNCSTTKESRSIPPSKLLRQAKKFFKNDTPQKAKDSVETIMEDFPDSKERIAALMLLSDIHYKEREFEEAKFNYQKFTELYPAHKFADRAHFYKAMANYRLSDLASRDLTPVHSALEGFETFIHDFPKSIYKDQAQKKNQKVSGYFGSKYF